MTTSAGWFATLKKLLPRGPLWNWVPNGILQSFLLAIADVLFWFQGLAQQLTVDADPRTTTNLLPDWESSCGLPDSCVPGGGSTTQRRNAIVGKLLETGGCNFAYYIELAAAYGYTITCADLGPNQWVVISPLGSGLTNMTCDGTCDDPLESFGNTQLECLINRVKQAHVQVFFEYTGG